VGAAITIQYNGTDNVAFFFVGDGAANRGPVSEAMTLAADWKLPVVFVCINNGFAISTPSTIGPASPNASVHSSPVPHVLADRAVGYGMPSWVSDGTDVLDTYEKASEAVQYAREGKGPAVLECVCYRWKGHFEGDQCPYREADYTKEQVENHDCLKRFEELLMGEGILTAEGIEKQRADYEREMNEAVARAEAAPEMTADEIYDYLYV
jgi:pyruvate dehydrogenase E1 component alpha subunit